MDVPTNPRSEQLNRDRQVDEFLARLTGSGDGEFSTEETMELSRGYSADA
jgi:hypothetical protein